MSSADPSRPGVACPPAEIVLLYCQHCVREGADVAAACAAADGLRVRPAMQPCSSKVQASDLLRLLETGAEAVEVVACDSQACRFLAGSLRAEKRVAYVQGLLEQVQVGAARVGLSRGGDLSAEELVARAAARAAAAAPLGPNPIRRVKG